MGHQLLSAAKSRKIIINVNTYADLKAMLMCDRMGLIMFFQIVKLFSQLKRIWKKKSTKSYMEVELQMRPLPIQRFFKGIFEKYI